LKKYIPFLTLIVIITSLVFFKCSNYEEEKKKNYEDYSDKSLITILHINQNYENHRLKGKVKKLKVKTFGLNPQPLNPKEKNDFIKSLYHEKIFEFDSLGRLIHEKYKMYETQKTQSRPTTFIKYTDSIEVKMYYKYDLNNLKEVELINFYIDDELYKQNIFLYKDTLIKKRFIIDKEGKTIFELEHQYDKDDNLLWMEVKTDDKKLGIHKFTVKGNQSIWNQEFRLIII
jgi:hypothetical protein